jgi:hypothetical protein
MVLVALLVLLCGIFLVVVGIAARRRRIVVVAAAGGAGTAVTPATRRRATAPAPLAADGPGAHALRFLDPLGDADLFRTARVRRVTGATIGPPRRRQELQSTLVPISGVDRPVPAGLALSDGVPIGRRREACAPEGEATDQDERHTTAQDDLSHAHCLAPITVWQRRGKATQVTAISQTRLRKALMPVRSV